MKKIKKLLVAVLAAVTVVTGVTGCSKQDSIVAVIDGVKVPESLYKTYLWSTSQFFEQLAGPTIWEMELEGKKSEEIAKERALESVVLSVVTTNKADELGIKLTKEEEKSIKEDAKDFVKSQEQLVRAHGFDEKDVEKLLLATELCTKVQEKLGENYIPKDEEVEKFLEEAKPYADETKMRENYINGEKMKFANTEIEELISNAKVEKTELYDDVQVVVQNAPEKEQNASPNKEADASKEENNDKPTSDGTTN